MGRIVIEESPLRRVRLDEIAQRNRAAADLVRASSLSATSKGALTEALLEIRELMQLLALVLDRQGVEVVGMRDLTADMRDQR